MNTVLTDFSDIKTVISLRNHDVIYSIRSELMAHGIKSITTCYSTDELEEILNLTSTDLLICELILPDEDVFEMIKSIRVGELGCNAYAVLVAITKQTHLEHMQIALNAGFDDVIAEPISIGLLINRLLHLAKQRKPFVMKANYIGPDRRLDSEVSGKRVQSPILVETPNPLANDGASPELIEQFEKALSEVISVRIDRLRLEAYKKISSKVKGLIQKISAELETEEVRPLAMELKELLVNYYEIIGHGVLSELKAADETVLELVDDIGEHHKNAWREDFDSLQQLMELVKHAH